LFRLACLRKTKLLDRMEEDLGASLKNHLAAVNKDLAIARERLVHYEAQCARRN
jgi:hypothetical protein